MLQFIQKACSNVVLAELYCRQGCHALNGIWKRTMTILLGLAVLASIAGCTQDPGEAKTSHFEHDHEVAEHWPEDLADAAAKIRQRLAWLDGSEEPPAGDTDHVRDPSSEIADIVSWVPEIAADTNLSEKDWIPLDSVAVALSASLRAAGNELTEPNRRQTLVLCEQIEQSLALIPEHLPLWNESSP